MRLLSLFFILLITCSSNFLLAQPSAKIRMEVGPREITIGDPIQCQVTVQFSSTMIASPLTLPTTGDIEVLAYHPPLIKQLASGEHEAVHQITLTTFATGTVVISAFQLQFTSPDGQIAQAATNPVEINVISLLDKHGDEGQLRPMKGLFNFRSYFWITLILILMAIGALAFFIFRAIRSRKQLISGPQKPALPPHQIALQSLADLENSTLLADGNVKEYYSQLSIISRTYLENRFRISCLDRTTAELMTEFRRQNFSLDITTVMRLFFENGDLVKFAKFTPDENEILSDLQRVKTFISLTTPQEISPQEKLPV